MKLVTLKASRPFVKSWHSAFKYANSLSLKYHWQVITNHPRNRQSLLIFLAAKLRTLPLPEDLSRQVWRVWQEGFPGGQLEVHLVTAWRDTEQLMVSSTNNCTFILHTWFADIIEDDLKAPSQQNFKCYVRAVAASFCSYLICSQGCTEDNFISLVKNKYPVVGW